MISILQSFGCGLAFAFGAVFGIWITSLFRSREMIAHTKSVLSSQERCEDRLEKQVQAMTAACDGIAVLLTKEEDRA